MIERQLGKYREALAETRETLAAYDHETVQQAASRVARERDEAVRRADEARERAANLAHNYSQALAERDEAVADLNTLWDRLGGPEGEIELRRAAREAKQLRAERDEALSFIEKWQRVADESLAAVREGGNTALPAIVSAILAAERAEAAMRELAWRWCLKARTEADGADVAWRDRDEAVAIAMGVLAHAEREVASATEDADTLRELAWRWCIEARSQRRRAERLLVTVEQ